MTSEEIVKSAIGEEISYYGRQKWIVSEIIRNHVVLKRDGEEDEMEKIDSIASLITEGRKFREKESQPGIETYFSANKPLVNAYEYHKTKESAYFGFGMNVYDCGVSMKNTSAKGQDFLNHGNGCYVLKRNFSFGSGGKSEWYNSPGFAIKSKCTFYAYTQHIWGLNVNDGVYTPEKDGHGQYGIYFRDYEGNLNAHGWKWTIYNSSLEDIRTDIGQRCIDTLYNLLMEKLGDEIYFYHKLKKRKGYEDRIIDEYWFFNKDRTWTTILTHTTRNDSDGNEGESKIDVEQCNVFGSGRIKRSRSTESVPKKTAEVTKDFVLTLCENTITSSLDGWLGDKLKSKINFFKGEKL